MTTSSRWALAWFLLSAALLLHIIEEAVGFYLNRYEALEILESMFLWVPLPPAKLQLWLINTGGTALVLLALTGLVARGTPIMRPASYALGAFAIANAMLHIALSVASAEVLAGAVTAPLLLIASLFLFVSIPEGKWRKDLVVA